MQIFYIKIFSWSLRSHQSSNSYSTSQVILNWISLLVGNCQLTCRVLDGVDWGRERGIHITRIHIIALNTHNSLLFQTLYPIFREISWLCHLSQLLQASDFLFRILLPFLRRTIFWLFLPTIMGAPSVIKFFHFSWL